MSRERRLSEDEESWLGPLTVAMFVDLGWIRETPLCITRRGLSAIRIGWGPTSPPEPIRGLPGMVTEIGGGLHWDGKRPNKPNTFRTKD